jgi:hypothetical protein
MGPSGTDVHTALLARWYGFTDVDGYRIEPFPGRVPHVARRIAVSGIRGFRAR